MIWDALRSMYSTIDTAPGLVDMSPPVVNPATGLPMLDGSFGGVDVGGSPFGVDTHSPTSSVAGGLGSDLWD